MQHFGENKVQMVMIRLFQAKKINNNFKFFI